MSSKRPHEPDTASSSKKFKSDSNSANGSSSAPSISSDALIAQKKAEIMARIATINAGRGGTLNIPTTSSARVAQNMPAPQADDVARRVEEAKRKVAEAQSRANPYLQQAKKGGPEPGPTGAGLKMAAHPLLLDVSTPAPQSKKDRYKPMQPKFASIKANARNAPTPPPVAVAPMPIEARANPYSTAAASASVKESGFEGAPKEKIGKSFRFNQKGKYIAMGNQLRQEAKLEELKQRIAESAKKAGLDNEFEVAEKNVRREAPPAAEWWDVSLLPHKTYDDLVMGMSTLNVRNPDSPITIYVQHPIPIPGNADKDKVALKPLMLTKKEQKKMRKQRRQAELQDKRDKIKMGLIPPDPPKVRLANLMKVLTSDAVQDPTKVEARVRREVTMRKHQHEKMNSERKLTDEQRREKIENKKLEEERKGLVAALFKIKILSDKSQDYKVRITAKELNLTGVCIYNPSFAFVYVEGGQRFIKKYKRLLLQRIRWTEPARSREGDGGDIDLDFDSDKEEGGEAASTIKGKGKEVVTDSGIVSLEDNRCDLIWEGEIADRAFRTFKPRTCPTDTTAKEVLGEKLAGYWDLAKNWKPSEDELF
ncbi:hypothetical protein M422DRAFT_35999 [Sphaerobolus stellatus SS14]|uniref:Uncharacterized protein n=1 Tax=Sphaerobolus stellatus (strain SS14) TaxID=990650 RepID=A0A0C9US86_SPHS4|nr:hypothetical protein M422DRAFT_35999 [Sphaerobolus stellatus SS14]